MKKTLLAIILSGGAMMATNVSANTGTVNFNGKVTSATCNIGPVVGGNPVTAVDLGIATLTSDATAVDFQLKPDAGSDCLTKTNARVEWSGPLDSIGFSNTATGNSAAQGFSMSMRATNAGAGSTGANIKNSYTAVDYNFTNGPIESFNYTVQLKKDASAAAHQGGLFATAASFVVTYM